MSHREERTRIFLACALLGLRPGEARALDISDVRDGWLTVDKAVKGARASAPIRGTKTGKAKRLPIPDAIAEWVASNVDPAGRLRGEPLFVNPNTGRRWSHWALTDRWKAACRAAGVDGVRLYEGTKHTMATDAVRRGVTERALQSFLGHRDVRSTRRYARMGDEALVSVLRRPGATQNSDDLSLACPETVSGSEKPFETSRSMASPTGLEPVLPP